MSEPFYPDSQIPSQAAIQHILPHRYPFLLVDRVVEFVPGERIAGTKHFSANDATSRAGSPSAQVISNVLLLEAVTQLGAILVLERPGMAGKVAVILQIPSARMLRPARIGDTVRLEAKMLRIGELFGELEGFAYSGKELIATGRMRFALTDRAAFEPKRAES